MTQYKVIDAFCGAGGLSIGLSKAGLNVVCGFDIDPLCIKTQQMNPQYIDHAVVEADVRSMLNGGLQEITGLEPEELDVLAGGPPCQGFSIQRTVGEDFDERNLLVDDYGDLIKEVRPRLFLMENVTGLGGKRGSLLLKAFERKVGLEGYVVHKRILDAQDYGVPQRRKRLLMVGERLDSGLAAYSWPVPDESLPPTVYETIGHLPPPPDTGKDHPSFPGHRTDRLSSKNLARLKALTEGQSRVDLPKELLADCHTVSADVVGHRNVYGRMEWDKVAPTITARFDSFTRGKFGHPVQMRTISLYEGQLLQTFPRDYKFCGTKVEMARQIGNAVPPMFAHSLGRAIVDALTAKDM
ncbi:MAG: DNA cytosine methyltransferase [Gammaproteobacteria bacterium]|nr:DNA cytosine methyltransferase [Gammaproteobacteria bacterium]MYG97204.1 DNA cytosine methyltransferase [Gammaproteobacteria bacterium]